MICYILITIVVASWIAYEVVAVFACSPITYQWDRSSPEGHCIDIETWYKTTAAPNIATDLAIMILPIPTIINLQVSVSQKMGLAVVFFVGGV